MSAAPPKPIGFEINYDVMRDERKNKLFVAVPMYGGQCVGTFSRCMMDLAAHCKEVKIDLKVYELFNESLVTRARNYCVDEFLRSDCTHFMFIDADIGFNYIDIMAMMWMMTDESPYDILCGPYPKKCISWEKIVGAVHAGVADKNPELLSNFVGDYVFNIKPTPDGKVYLTQPVEILEGGTGFMMIRRKTFEKFRDAYPQYNYKPDHVRSAAFDGTREIMQFFQAEIDGIDFSREYSELLGKALTFMDGDMSEDASTTRVLLKDLIEDGLKDIAEKQNKKSKRYLSEDYWFCQKCNDIGLRTFLLPWVRLTHTGSYIFSGNLLDIFAIGQSPTADPSKLKR